MTPSRGQSMTIEWEPLEISSKQSNEPKGLEPSLNSLSSTPEELHLAFFDKAEHLNEAISNQNLITEITGRIPEKLKLNHNIISLDSIANEFNGVVNESTLSIPFKGISENQINIEYTKIESNWAIKLSIDSIKLDDLPIIRTFLLPKLANKPSANMSFDNLNITF